MKSKKTDLTVYCGGTENVSCNRMEQPHCRTGSPNADQNNSCTALAITYGLDGKVSGGIKKKTILESVSLIKKERQN